MEIHLNSRYMYRNLHILNNVLTSCVKYDLLRPYILLPFIANGTLLCGIRAIYMLNFERPHMTSVIAQWRKQPLAALTHAPTRSFACSLVRSLTKVHCNHLHFKCAANRLSFCQSTTCAESKTFAKSIMHNFVSSSMNIEHSNLKCTSCVYLLN